MADSEKKITFQFPIMQRHVDMAESVIRLLAEDGIPLMDAIILLVVALADRVTVGTGRSVEQDSGSRRRLPGPH